MPHEGAATCSGASRSWGWVSKLFWWGCAWSEVCGRLFTNRSARASKDLHCIFGLQTSRTSSEAADLSNSRPEQPKRETKFSNCHGQLEKKRAGGRDDRDRNSILGTAFSGVSSVRRTAAQSVPAGSGGGAGIKS